MWEWILCFEKFLHVSFVYTLKYLDLQTIKANILRIFSKFSSLSQKNLHNIIIDRINSITLKTNKKVDCEKEI